MLKLLSNHDPRLLTHGLGLIRLLPTVMEHEFSFCDAITSLTYWKLVKSNCYNYMLFDFQAQGYTDMKENKKSSYRDTP